MPSEPAPPIPWWGAYDIPHGRAGRFRVGPLQLTACRLASEWLVVRETVGDDGDATVHIEVPTDAGAAPPAATVTRYATSSDTERLRLVPVLPDRSVIVRPERPLTILPRTQVTLYVGSPVWIRLLQGDAQLLGDLPVMAPKETWLGTTPIEGEVCYATRTFGRLVLEELTPRPHRVTTEVAIRNDADTTFVCDRVSLPVRRLSVHAAAGRLWTETVTLERSSAEGFAELRIGSGPPPAALSPSRVTEPRDAATDGLFRAFGALFG